MGQDGEEEIFFLSNGLTVDYASAINATAPVNLITEAVGVVTSHAGLLPAPDAQSIWKASKQVNPTQSDNLTPKLGPLTVTVPQGLGRQSVVLRSHTTHLGLKGVQGQTVRDTGERREGKSRSTLLATGRPWTRDA